MCTAPKFIINPSLVKRRMEFDFIHTPDCDYICPCVSLPSEFPFKFFYSRCSVSTDNLSSFYAYSLKTGDTIPLFIPASCGKCFECLKSKSSVISSRCALDATFTGFDSYFITLTYNDENLPLHGVNKRDIQLFFKKFRNLFRKNFGYSPLFTWYCASEYGSKFHRPHYHLIINGFDISVFGTQSFFKFQSFLEKCWSTAYYKSSLGFVYLKSISSLKGFDYVSKYVYKGSYVPHGMNSTFYLSSHLPAIGSLYCVDFSFLENLPQYDVSIRYHFDIRNVSLPKYYFDKYAPSDCNILPKNVYSSLKYLCYISPYLYKSKYNCFFNFKSIYFSELLRFKPMFPFYFPPISLKNVNSRFIVSKYSLNKVFKCLEIIRSYDFNSNPYFPFIERIRALRTSRASYFANKLSLRPVSFVRSAVLLNENKYISSHILNRDNQ